jgi:Ca2+-binding EF-hand superfamily protein
MSHASIITSKVREKMRPMYKDFIASYMTKVQTIPNANDDCEFMAYEDFKQMLKDLLGDQIVEHEILTLCRHYGIKQKKSPRAHRETMRSIVHGILTRELWDDLERLKEYLYHLSPERSDHLTEQQVLTTIRACRIPLDAAIIRQLFDVLNRNECNEIEIQDFINFLNMKCIKTSPVPPVNPKVNQFKFGTDEGNLIDWKMFIATIDLEENLKLSD